jgi:hypothetical protein
MDVDQGLTQSYREMATPRAKRTASPNPLEDDPLVGEDAVRSLRHVRLGSAVSLRACRKYSSVNCLMSLVERFEPRQLPRPDDAEHVLTG